MEDACYLFVADYPIYPSVGDIDPIIMTIFRESDRRVFERRIAERNRLVWGIDELDLSDENEMEIVYEYANTVANIRQRLDVMGFSLRRVREEFYKVLAEDSVSHESQINRFVASSKKTDDAYWQHLRIRGQLLNESSFEDWIAAFREIVSKKLIWTGKHHDSQLSRNPLVQYILEESRDFIFNYPCRDFRCFLRFLTEVCADNDLVVQDITDNIATGHYNTNDAVCDMALKELIGDYPINERILILTEGSTDKFVLERSLKILYPHLYEYFSFMDFGLANASGGASSLVAVIKAFIGSGINNRTMALFDNDTAARAARKGLAKTPVPNNIRIIEYPNLEFAKNYPTIGPNGISELDINGLACSIELYFGIDVLTQNGELTPVQWKGYDESLRQYQGEVNNKRILQDLFFEKCSKCIADPSLIAKMDWESMRLLLQTLFMAFG